MDEEQVFYAEIPKGETKRQTIQAGHDRFSRDRISGELQATSVLRQPLHVGSGQLLPPDVIGLKSGAPLIKPFYRAGKQLRIPGSSIKGAIRSLVETFTESCVPSARREACRFEVNRAQAALCPACRIFGAMGFAGNFHFQDGLFLKGTRRRLEYLPPQYGPKAHDGRLRYYPHAKVDGRERTWPVEVISEGSTFLLRATFEQLTPGELGLVLIALGQGPRKLCPKLGAGKSSGLGAVEFKELEVRIAPKDAYLNMDAQTVARPLDGFVKAAAEMIVQDALEQLAEDMGCGELGGDKP